ncbi:MAG: hypothetical protein SF029_26600 [bacterium]|nr:hypothetical protein [bacterium]
MSKRREKSDLSQDALERAQQEINQTAAPAPVEKPKRETPSAAPVARSTKTVSERRRERTSSSGSSSARRSPTAPVQYSQINKKSDGMTSERVQQLLANPTKFVSEDDLRKEYGHVVTDIRNMGVLTGVLLVLLVVLAQFI